MLACSPRCASAREAIAQAPVVALRLPVASLSARERQIITMVVSGQSSTAIGEMLHLSPKTVDTYRSRIMTKLGVTDITSLVRLAVRIGLIDND